MDKDKECYMSTMTYFKFAYENLIRLREQLLEYTGERITKEEYNNAIIRNDVEENRLSETIDYIYEIVYLCAIKGENNKVIENLEDYIKIIGYYNNVFLEKIYKSKNTLRQNEKMAEKIINSIDEYINKYVNTIKFLIELEKKREIVQVSSTRRKYKK